MSETAIRVENLGKRYRIGAHQKRANTLRETLQNLAASPFDYLRSTLRGPSEDEIIWALKDVSFQVKQGEVVGIIGRNGAGKSTLLKILSRITEPTEGRAEVYGRVGSLLEVGTGFHPELTGRENIYLNGAILGMKKAEIDRKFDEIVAFAEVEKFIDTPVKRYSSGMYVRLAFAVAAHLEPEILLVDEVLAVGDAAFQKKCLGKMGDVAREGRTVLFVSHNMGAINSLCPRTILLEQGRIVLNGESSVVIEYYLGSNSNVERDGEITFPESESDAYFNRVAVVDKARGVTSIVDVRKPFHILLEYTLRRSISDLEVSFSVFNRTGTKVFACLKSTDRNDAHLDKPGRYQSMIEIPASFLAPGFYTVTIALHQPNVQIFDTHRHVIKFRVVETGSHIQRFSRADMGVVLVDFPWQTTRQGDEADGSSSENNTCSGR